jgi:hypothetical protein
VKRLFKGEAYRLTGYGIIMVLSIPCSVRDKMLAENILLMLQSISAIQKNFNTFPFPAFFNFNTGFALSDGMTGFIGETECINRSCFFFLKLPTSFIRIGE